MGVSKHWVASKLVGLTLFGLFSGRIVGVATEVWLFAFFEGLHDCASFEDAILPFLFPVGVKWPEK